MRILHTADWHLGKLFYGSYLTEEQDYVLKTQLLPLIKDEGIDAVVLSGDVYDRSLPPTERSPSLMKLRPKSRPN